MKTLKGFKVSLPGFLTKSKKDNMPKYINTIRKEKVNQVAEFMYDGKYRAVVVRINDKKSIRGFQMNDHNKFKRFNKNKIENKKIVITEYID